VLIRLRSPRNMPVLATRGGRDTALDILNLGTGRVVNASSCHNPGKDPRYPLRKRLGEPQGRS
jgi:hypothetical protein